VVFAPNIYQMTFSGRRCGGATPKAESKSRMAQCRRRRPMRHNFCRRIL